MIKKTFLKTLSANDVGATGGHQAGILIPKSETDLLDFLPALDCSIKNPDAWISCLDESGTMWRFRFVYYNNRLHDPSGTRNEYRITYMTRYFREAEARPGDTIELSREEGKSHYTVRIIDERIEAPPKDEQQIFRIKIKSSWRRVH